MSVSRFCRIYDDFLFRQLHVQARRLKLLRNVVDHTGTYLSYYLCIANLQVKSLWNLVYYYNCDIVQRKFGINVLYNVVAKQNESLCLLCSLLKCIYSLIISCLFDFYTFVEYFVHMHLWQWNNSICGAWVRLGYCEITANKTYIISLCTNTSVFRSLSRPRVLCIMCRHEPAFRRTSMAPSSRSSTYYLVTCADLLWPDLYRWLQSGDGSIMES